ncbi:hypothetical protein H0G86_000689 [Trichoderma simmonsii]|uniref:Uncharacterized protein n=1 Tax=Trichoderma simmonsii TaxID=1491479 RepID=A0A8G0L528_9HYPO|nr:hypothetical protein H0G86_000689 [Trichoderma simmonsii]
MEVTALGPPQLGYLQPPIFFLFTCLEMHTKKSPVHVRVRPWQASSSSYHPNRHQCKRTSRLQQVRLSLDSVILLFARVSFGDLPSDMLLGSNRHPPANRHQGPGSNQYLASMVTTLNPKSTQPHLMPSHAPHPAKTLSRRVLVGFLRASRGLRPNRQSGEAQIPQRRMIRTT